MNDQIEKLRAKLAAIKGSDPISRTRRQAILKEIWRLESAVDHE